MVAVDLCSQCAASAGLLPAEQLPLNEILNEFVRAHSEMAAADSPRCADCGMTWQEFKDTGLLGCVKDYEIFGQELEAVIEKAQQGAKRHTGKPRMSRMVGDQAVETGATTRQAGTAMAIKQLRTELAQAVEAESYEQAAKLRDQIRSLEKLV